LLPQDKKLRRVAQGTSHAPAQAAGFDQTLARAPAEQQKTRALAFGGGGALAAARQFDEAAGLLSFFRVQPLLLKRFP